MYKAIINKFATCFFYDSNNDKFETEDIMGFLINHKNVVDLIKNLPISDFYLQDEEGNKEKITVEEAMILYEELKINEEGFTKIMNNLKRRM